MKRYYYYESFSKTVYYSHKQEENHEGRQFLGVSENPNIRMAVAVMVKNLPDNDGYKIKPF